MNKLLCTLVAAVTLAGLGAHAQTPPPAAGNPGRGPMAMATGCSFQVQNRQFRPGEDLPATMSLHNTGQSCMGSVGMAGVSPSGSRVADQPGHGELRIKVLPNGIIFVYQPVPGYQGEDSFRITLPSGNGSEFYLAASVRVEP